MNVSVCLCVCLSVHDHIFGTTRPIFTKFFVHVTCGPITIWWHSDMLCTYEWRQVCSWAKVAGRRRTAEAQCTCSLGHGYKLCAVIPVAGQRMHRTTFRALKVTSRVSAPGAESVVYDCLVLFRVRCADSWPVAWQHVDWASAASRAHSRGSWGRRRPCRSVRWSPATRTAGQTPRTTWHSGAAVGCARRSLASTAGCRPSPSSCSPPAAHHRRQRAINSAVRNFERHLTY